MLTTAFGLAQMLEADIEALHVSEGSGSDRVARGAMKAVGVHLTRKAGPVAETILDALGDPEVVAAVMGTRAWKDGPRPTGGIAAQVIAGMSKPVAFVPPEAYRLTPDAPTRLLVPLDGGVSASAAFLNLERRLLSDPEREITVLLSFESNGKMPPMLDRPTRGLAEWGQAFLHRHCPGENRSFEARTGDPGSAVIEVAEKTNSDLIVLSFKGNFGWGHGWIVREVLARSVVPVLLLPAPFAQLPADVTVTAIESGHEREHMAPR